MSAITSGRVRYRNYKGTNNPIKGSKNRRRNKRSIQRNEEKIMKRLAMLDAERTKNLERTRYAREAREYETRYDYM